jgi:CheY-like chemotaxis protein
LRGLTVLVVEDDPDLRELSSELLESFGARCLVASGGDEAFRIFLRDRPDVLVSDLWMANGDGFELIRRIRELPPEDAGLTPAIAVSAAANAEQALMAGYHVLVPKPYELEDLVEIIAHFQPTTDTSAPSGVWTVSSSAPGQLMLALVGYVRVADIRAALEVVATYLDERPREMVADLRGLTGFSPAAASAAERIIWQRRKRILRVSIVGGPALARLAASAACTLLGVPYTVTR